MSSSDRAMKLRNTPLPASWLKNAAPPEAGPFPPPPPPCGAAAFRPIPISSGNSAATSSSNWLRRRKKVTRSSLAKNLRFARTDPTDSGPSVLAAGRADVSSALVSSTFDIEALPGQADEQVLQARGLNGKTADGDARVHQFGVDALRLNVAELGRDRVFARHRIGQAELLHDLGRRRQVGGADRDPGSGGAAQRRQLALENQLAGAHHADVGGHLLDLGQQVG